MSDGTVLPDRTTFSGSSLRHLALPLGGIGTGTVALSGYGGLRQWQLHNQVNHRAAVPNSFFAIAAARDGDLKRELRILASDEVLQPTPEPTPLVDDDYVPEHERALLVDCRGFENVVAESGYPFLRLDFSDRTFPLGVRLEAFNPFVPLDDDASSLPAVVFRLALSNPSERGVSLRIAAAQQNLVGWDGLTPISGNRCDLFGGNVNQVRSTDSGVQILMENPSLDETDEHYGNLVLAAATANAVAVPQWSNPQTLLDLLAGAELDDSSAGRRPGDAGLPAGPRGASPQGTTWSGGILVPVRLEPHSSASVEFVLTWFFPNRRVNWLNFGSKRGVTERFWLGNHYARRFRSAVAVAELIAERRDELELRSRRWTESFGDVGDQGWLSSHLANQPAQLRTPVIFRADDGNVFGFEGGNGASTIADGRAFGGSCPLNCTHVWNYEHTLAYLFPQLERTMRETELNVMLDARGALPHRTILPLTSPQFRGLIGGPDEPALDGMLGCVLKCYRELRICGDTAWLQQLWPNLKRLLFHVMNTWDADGDGLLAGTQPNTYDIAFRGTDPFVGVLWLAALKASARLAAIAGDLEFEQLLSARLDLAGAGYDELCWNGAYYEQRLPEGADTNDQFVGGCLSDQLLGQWWAHELDLGYVLPREHVRTALASIVEHNFFSPLGPHPAGSRNFGDGDEAGLRLCTWPHGGRPAAAFAYADEVWTGVEYQVAAHCLREGLREQALAILRGLHDRYDGRRRNPFNQIECGDHYVRALAGWSVVRALSAAGYDATTRTITVDHAPLLPLGLPWVEGACWCRIERDAHETRIYVEEGELIVDAVVVEGCRDVDATISTPNARPRAFHPGTPARLVSGSVLQLSTSDQEVHA